MGREIPAHRHLERRMADFFTRHDGYALPPGGWILTLSHSPTCMQPRRAAHLG
jgi:hypothetical protein